MSKNVLGEKLQTLSHISPNDPNYKNAHARFLQEYYAMRKQSEESLLGRLSMSQRKQLHPLMLQIIKLKNRMEGISVEVLNDRRKKGGKTTIFAVTHVGKSDVEAVSEAIGSHYTLLSGDYERMQGTINETFLKLNGVVYVCEHDREDRRSAIGRLVEQLAQGVNLMYFPEGTWNLSDHLPVLPCYWGIIEVAQRGDAVIVPVAAEQYEKHFVVNIGEEIDVKPYGEDKGVAIGIVRDAMATLKWKIWESRPRVKRQDIPKDEWTSFIQQRLAEWPLTQEEVWNAVFLPKEITPPRDAFAHLATIQINQRNAFLLKGNRKIL